MTIGTQIRLAASTILPQVQGASMYSGEKSPVMARPVLANTR